MHEYGIENQSKAYLVLYSGTKNFCTPPPQWFCSSSLTQISPGSELTLSDNPLCFSDFWFTVVIEQSCNLMVNSSKH